MDEVLTPESERVPTPPPKIFMEGIGEEFIAMQEEAESASCSILNDIVESAADEYIERYYQSLVPEYEVQRMLGVFDAMLEWCFPIKDQGEMECETSPSWKPGLPPPPLPIDSWACGAVPVKIEPRIPDSLMRQELSSSRISTTRGSHVNQRYIGGSSAQTPLDETLERGGGSSTMSRKFGGLSGSGFISNDTKSGKGRLGTGQKGGLGNTNNRGPATEEKRGSKVVIRMAQPLQQQPAVGSSALQNEAIRAAVEAERKQREEAKEKMALQARLEQERTQKLKQSLRGKAYAYTTNGVVMLKPVNPEKLADVTVVPNIVTKKEEPEIKEEPADKQKKKGGEKDTQKTPSSSSSSLSSTSAAKKADSSSNSSSAAASSSKTTSDRKTSPSTIKPSSKHLSSNAASTSKKKDETKDKTKAPAAQSLLALFPDRRDGQFKPSEAAQPPIPDNLRLQPGVTLKIGDQVKSGGPPRLGKKSSTGGPKMSPIAGFSGSGGGASGNSQLSSMLLSYQDRSKK
ncbi:uncharacterized protein MONOS_8561 [Monocercomonoides exilis]|uniref:uncharacterized protein n=1 Tax=Monocercomonoides exilis TaxID=2049356 RepID=UPI003559DD61|nr:hypothetical protein MONOS_8561 [Monocercomonoides exilis]|eukprot:MONOS_8561.1-p1 / transcript=MONOS_8561.1 / gene=MONOS_8561 / organism=Monocercomonoides_exilis_PA203 / gene_product=unspecified product / transcript_product=unspecified product / location=Mono_scaffold00326:10554-12523(+) / protein_length=515 / sequence_SO=supercontig / SO=protein_coding / is_pseudo=false